MTFVPTMILGNVTTTSHNLCYVATPFIWHV